MPAPIVILSTADFDSAVWTNKQHLAVGLAAHRPVVYIESLGLREPRVRWADARRVLAKLRRRAAAVVSSRPVPADLTIVTPRILPWHRFAIVRRINRLILDRTVARRLPDDPDAVFWSFSPLAYGLDQRFAHRVYHSVDLLHEIPGIPSTALLAAERGVIADAHVVVASSTVVAAHLRDQGADEVLLWENVAQTEIFARHAAEREDRVIFAGNLTPTKIDYGLLLQLLDRGVKVDLAGPAAIDGTTAGAQMRAVLDHPNTRSLGLLSLDEMAAAFARCRVGVIPYLRNPYTAGVFPMKVHEYLAAGLAVVATTIPSLAGADIEGLDVVDDAHFADAVVSALTAFDDEAARRRTRAAAANSWTRRIEQATGLVDTLTAPVLEGPAVMTERLR